MRRVSEVKRLIMKISNPESNEQEECADQSVHVLQDTLEQTWKMKGSKSRSLNYVNKDADNCGVPSKSEGAKSDDDLCNFLDMELSNSKY